ncbi:MAG: 4-hydroxybenzoate octaprenyltransferase [Alphaproteobacteria bacterium]|nr:4-hydroxybenzoate octaprenyltransferase [Alphaproteobacteria bacterium]
MSSRSDITTSSWVAWLPDALIPYAQLARFDRPVGWWLLVLPAWWAILTATMVMNIPLMDSARVMALFLIGAMVMRGAGCVINDLWDRDLDRAVARTRDRALAAGVISFNGAMVFLAGLLAIGLVVLVQLPLTAFWTGVASLPLIVIYPLAKRFTGLPQIVLALTFSWGAWLGWSAFGAWPGVMAGVLYLAAAFWVFGYDTIYAIQDMEDDRKIGIRSAALTLGDNLKPVVVMCYAMMLLALLLAGALRDAAGVYYLGLGGVAIHLNTQIRRIDLTDPQGAGALFRSNRNTGLILTLALAIEAVTRNGPGL